MTQLAVLIATLLWAMTVWSGILIGKEALCSEIYQAQYEAPISEGGCGGSLDGCPVEAPDNWQAVQDACRDVNWHIITEAQPAATLPPYEPLPPPAPRL